MDQVLNQVRDQLSWRLFSLQARLNNASKSHDDMGDGKANASNTQSKPFHSELDGVKEIETAISSMTVTTVEGPIANLNTDCLIAIFCSLPSFADVTNFSGACCAFKSSCNANVNLISNTVGSRAMSFYEEARDLVEVQEARLKLSRVTWLERTLRMEINHIQVFWAFLLIEKRPYRRNVSDRRSESIAPYVLKPIADAWKHRDLVRTSYIIYARKSLHTRGTGRENSFESCFRLLVHL